MNKKYLSAYFDFNDINIKCEVKIRQDAQLNAIRFRSEIQHIFRQVNRKSTTEDIAAQIFKEVSLRFTNVVVRVSDGSYGYEIAD